MDQFENDYLVDDEHSPAPGTPQTATKAKIALALAFLVLVAQAWIADTGDFTAKEFAAALVFAAIGSGLVGGATYSVRNRSKA